jgi:hypothetical protein
VAAETKSDKIMVEPLPKIIEELQVSIDAAKEAAREARKAAEEAKLAGKEIPKEFIRKLISSGEFLTILIVIALATILSAVAISLGLSLLGR